MRLGRRVLRLDRLDRRGPRRRRDRRRAVHAPSRVGDVRAAPLGRLAGRAQVEDAPRVADARAHRRVGAVRTEHARVRQREPRAVRRPWCRGSKAKPQFLVVLDCLGSSRAMDLTLTIKESEKDARKRPRELRRQNAKPEKPVHKPKLTKQAPTPRSARPQELLLGNASVPGPGPRRAAPPRPPLHTNTPPSGRSGRPGPIQNPRCPPRA